MPERRCRKKSESLNKDGAILIKYPADGIEKNAGYAAGVDPETRRIRERISR